MTHPSAEHARYRALLPAPQPPREASPKKKRRLTRVACNNCRSKKLGCDGRRPCKSCASSELECIYISNNSSETPQMVLRRELLALRAEAGDLRDMIDYLIAGPEDRVQDVLRRLRSGQTVASVLEGLREPALDGDETPASTCEDTDSSTPLQQVSTLSDYGEWHHLQPVEEPIDESVNTSTSTSSFTRSWLDTQPWAPGGPKTSTFCEAPTTTVPTDPAWAVYGTMHGDPPYMMPTSGFPLQYMPQGFEEHAQNRNLQYVDTDLQTRSVM